MVQLLVADLRILLVKILVRLAVGRTIRLGGEILLLVVDKETKQTESMQQ